jgi:autotransporter-associated beta strand protein
MHTFNKVLLILFFPILIYCDETSTITDYSTDNPTIAGTLGFYMDQNITGAHYIRGDQSIIGNHSSPLDINIGENKHLVNTTQTSALNYDITHIARSAIFNFYELSQFTVHNVTSFTESNGEVDFSLQNDGHRDFYVRSLLQDFTFHGEIENANPANSPTLDIHKYGTYTATFSGDGFDRIRNMKVYDGMLHFHNAAPQLSGAEKTTIQLYKGTMKFSELDVPCNINYYEYLAASQPPLCLIDNATAKTLSGILLDQNGVGKLQKDSAGTLTINNDNNNFSGHVEIASGTVSFEHSQDVEYGGNISGSGNLSVTNSNLSEVQLSGAAKTYTGNTYLLAGKLKVSNSNIDSSNSITLSAGTTLTYDSITSSKDITNSGDFRTLSSSGYSLYAGTITGGNFYVDSGEIRFNGEAKTAAPTRVASICHMKGTGLFYGVSNYGTVSPGNSIGTMTIDVDDYTHQTGSNLIIEFDDASNSSAINVLNGNDFIIASDSTLTLLPQIGEHIPGTYTFVTADGVVTNTFDNLNIQFPERLGGLDVTLLKGDQDYRFQLSGTNSIISNNAFMLSLTSDLSRKMINLEQDAISSHFAIKQMQINPCLGFFNDFSKINSITPYFEVIHKYGKNTSTNNNNANKYYITGPFIGIDWMCSKNILLGCDFDVLVSKCNENDSQGQIKSKSVGGGIYSQIYTKYLLTNLSFQSHYKQYRISKDVTTGGRAIGNTSSADIEARLELNPTFCYKTLNIMPVFATEYNLCLIDSYSEKNGNQNLKLAKDNYQDLEVEIGLDLFKSFKVGIFNLIPEFFVKEVFNLLNTSRKVHAHFVNSTSSLTENVKIDRFVKNYTKVGGSFIVNANDSKMLFVQLQSEFSKRDRSNLEIKAGFELAF